MQPCKGITAGLWLHVLDFLNLRNVLSFQQFAKFDKTLLMLSSGNTVDTVSVFYCWRSKVWALVVPWFGRVNLYICREGKYNKINIWLFKNVYSTLVIMLLMDALNIKEDHACRVCKFEIGRHQIGKYYSKIYYNSMRRYIYIVVLCIHIWQFTSCVYKSLFIIDDISLVFCVWYILYMIVTCFIYILFEYNT